MIDELSFDPVFKSVMDKRHHGAEGFTRGISVPDFLRFWNIFEMLRL